ncbi:thiol reductant ABC exporter subunit CydC [Enterococcus wangshanyuanii]|uniref:Amino acid ABC transporter ATP-binding protein n=1 Tax=Enterococcus wangshanyuanii TaxID=2005703 RepID=A0ABQ1NYK9_9ENTE|nr:thiol reductant ABC exporter subunit CydC [Enterococcus wangshanyuanii]GGC87247.1 amino acid ABC transporter ATP-binding protein [Enterococcus wangshanyuanii]
MENTPTNQELYKKDQWVKPFLKKYKGLLYLALFLGFLTFFSAGALMFNSGYLISRAASLPENILMIYIPIVLTRAFGISRPVFRYIERLVSHNWVLKMTSDLRLKLYLVLEKDAIFFKSKYQTGDILGLLSEDINHLQNLYLRTIFPTVIAWLLYIFIIIGLGLFSWWFGLCMLLMLGVVVFLLPLISVLVNGARQEQQKVSKNELYKKLTDNILGVSDWVFSQRGHEFVHSYEKDEANLRELDERIKRFNRFRDFILQTAFGGITVAILAWTSVRFQGDHGGAANWIAAFTLTVFPLIDAFAPLPDAAQETNIYKDSIKRLNELPEVQQAQEAADLTIVGTEILIDDLSFSYDQTDHNVLENLTLTIQPKEKLAILGRSGSGKSTLASLIRGDLVPSKGTITLDGTPTADFGDQITRSIGVIHQAPYLFRTSILNNVRLGREEASEAEVWQVLASVGLKEMVQDLPEGLQTMVDEAGLRFSGGERHRLALARILLQDTPIVLLDEPTTGLDPITEQQLLNTFFETLADKTIIWITHHLQGVHMMDRVIFIEDGRLEMSGTPEELLATNQHYQQLYAIDRGTTTE